MTIGHGELMRECFSKHSRMGTTRMKYGKDKASNCGPAKGAGLSKVNGLKEVYSP